MSTPIQGITPLWEAFPSMEGSSAVSHADAEGAPGIFYSIFSSAIDNVKQTDAEYSEAQYLLATGQIDNPALVSIAGTKAETSVELLIQLRNKALDAYNELMRISL